MLLYFSLKSSHLQLHPSADPRKRFETEAEFARYKDRILESPDFCGFHDFLSDFDNEGNKIVKDDVIDDPTVAIGPVSEIIN